MKLIDIKTNGITRIVILIHNYAIKIPNFRICHLHFLQGCYANYAERQYYKSHSNISYKNNMSLHAAPSYFCMFFGILQIQARCEQNSKELTNEQIKFFETLHRGDKKKENFGYYKGKLVCLDYA